jgi:hypothetical protein
VVSTISTSVLPTQIVVTNDPTQCYALPIIWSGTVNSVQTYYSRTVSLTDGVPCAAVSPTQPASVVVPPVVNYQVPCDVIPCETETVLCVSSYWQDQAFGYCSY